MPLGQVLLDGEIVAFTDGRPDFEALQPRMHVSSADAAFRLSASIPVSYLAFDVLQLDGVRLTRAARTSTQENPHTIISNGPRLARPAQFPRPRSGRRPGARRSPTGSRAWWSSGSTRSTSPAPGSGNWLKVKNQLRQEVVVAGWKPGQGNRAGLIGSLLVGVHSDRPGRCSMRGMSAPGSPIRCCGCSPGGWSRCGGPTRRSTGRCPPSMRGPQYG